MRTPTAMLAYLTLALGFAGSGAAQDDVETQKYLIKETSGPPTNTKGPLVARDLVELAVRGAKAADAGGDELPEARRLLGNLRADPRFEEQTAEFRAAGLGTAGFVEMSLGEPAAAADLFQLAIALRDDEPDLWYWLSWVQSDLEDHDAAARSLAVLFQRWPELIDNISDEHIWRLALADDASQPARAELLQAIFDSGWKRAALGGPSRLHYELALIRAKQGDARALRDIVPSVTGPTEIVRMLSDKRFDAVVDAKNDAFDPRAAAERLVEALQAQQQLAPDRLDVVVELQTALLQVGRFQDVVRLGQEVQSAIAAAPVDKPPYRDMEKAVWVQNHQAAALQSLGQSDASLARLEAASRLEEGGRANVSQTLNLAQLYASLNRPDDALAAAARAGSDMSDYGRMVQASAEQRAYLRKGNAAAAAKALDYLRANRATSEPIYLDALVEAGDLDAAAAVLVAQLKSSDDRAEALFNLQEFNDLPPLPGNETYRNNWRRLEQHPEVVAAIAAVGRRLEVDLYVWQ